MDRANPPFGDEAFSRLHYLMSVGRQYESFAREHPQRVATQIAELNVAGLQDNAWDLRWLPDILRPRIARAASALVLDLCRPSEDAHDHAELMDVIMPVAIVTACVVAHTYGTQCPIPKTALHGRLEVFAKLLHRLTGNAPEEVEAGAAESCEGVLSMTALLSCVPMRICPRLICLARIIARASDPVGQNIAMCISLIGAIAADTFEPLDLNAMPSQPSTT